MKTDTYRYTNPLNLSLLPLHTAVDVRLYNGSEAPCTVVDNSDPSLYTLKHDRTGVEFRSGRSTVVRSYPDGR